MTATVNLKKKKKKAIKCIMIPKEKKFQFRTAVEVTRAPKITLKTDKGNELNIYPAILV